MNEACCSIAVDAGHKFTHDLLQDARSSLMRIAQPVVGKVEPPSMAYWCQLTMDRQEGRQRPTPSLGCPSRQVAWLGDAAVTTTSLGAGQPADAQHSPPFTLDLLCRFYVDLGCGGGVDFIGTS